MTFKTQNLTLSTRYSKTLLAACCLALVFVSCGKSKKSSTAVSTKTSSIYKIVPLLGVSSPLAKKATSASPYVSTDLKYMDELRSEIGKIIKKTDSSDCVSNISFSFNKTLPSCFSPGLAYSGTHPNAVSTFSASSVANCPSGATCIPPGQIGIASESDSSGESCSAATINDLIQESIDPIHNALKIFAAMACLGTIDLIDLPEAGSVTDLTSKFNSVFTLGSSGGARVYREGDYLSLSQPVYQSTFEANIKGSIVRWTLRNSPSGNGKDFRGRLYGYQTYQTETVTGWSLTYQQSGSSLFLELKTATTPLYFGTSELFDKYGEYQYTIFNNYKNSERGRYFLANLDKDTGLGTVKLAFQNDGQDKKAKVFWARSSTGSPDSGFTYFGYGPSFSTSDLTTIGGMCCNTAGPNASCYSSVSSYDVSDKVQSQTLSRSTSTGLFTASSSGISFAPTTSCSYSPTSSGGTDATGFKWASISSWGTDGSSITSSALTHSLGSITSLGTIENLTRPEFNPK